MSRLSHLLASCKSMTSMLYNYLDYPGLIGMQVKNIWQNFISCELRWVLRLFLWTRLGLHGGSARPGGRVDPKHVNSLRLEKDTMGKNLPVDPRQGSRNSYRESNSWIS